MYVDESGDHSLATVAQEYPVFVLAACLFDAEEYCGTVIPAVCRLKFRHFGHDQVILHEREIRKAKGPFAFLTDRERRFEFMGDLANLVDSSPFILVAGVIRKDLHLEAYAMPESPYDLALTFCLERLHLHLKPEVEAGQRVPIVVERRGKKEDKELELVFRRVCDGMNAVGERFPFNLQFADKLSNSSGLQLADLVARPIGRHEMAPDQPNRAWDVLVGKFRRSPRRVIKGWGLKRFP